MSRLYPEDISDIIDIRNNWTDPNPPPIVEMHHGFHVVRDDLLEYGSKSRFIDYLVNYPNAMNGSLVVQTKLVGVQSL